MSGAKSKVPPAVHPRKFYGPAAGGGSAVCATEVKEDDRIDCIFCHKSSFISRHFHVTKAAKHLVGCTLFESQASATYEEFCDHWNDIVNDFSSKRLV